MKKRKIVVIGPLPPYRGGISHSNSILCKNLSENNDVVAINFSSMYPKFLYPGRFQETGDVQSFPFLHMRILNSVNPVSWIKVFLEIRKICPEQVTFQWWHTFFAPAYFSITALTKIFTKAKTSMVIQGTIPHEENFFDTALAKAAFFQIDFFVSLSSSDAEKVKSLKKNAVVHFMPEPAYSEYFRSWKCREKNVKKKILFFGFVRKYKGLGYILKAMPAILEKIPELRLEIAGEFWHDKQEYLDLITSLEIGENVDITDRYIDDKEIPEIFSRVDAVVLPYISSQQSGVIQLAIGFCTPVISTDVGGNKDIIKNGVNGILVKPEDSGEISRAVIEFYKKSLGKKFRKELAKDRESLKWNGKKENIFFNTV